MVEEAELQEASKEGQDIATPDDIPLHADLSVTQVQLSVHPDGGVGVKDEMCHLVWVVHLV